MTQIIDGKALAAKLQGQLAEKTAKLKEETGIIYPNYAMPPDKSAPST